MLDIRTIYQQHAQGFWRWTPIERISIALLRSLLHERDINTFIEQHGHLNGRDFIEAVLNYFQVDYTTNRTITEIPQTGRLIVVANHPLGALDGLILLHTLLRIRPDVHIVANHYLTSILALKPHIIPVNNWQTTFSRQTIETIYHALQQEAVVIFFPAGEVSRKKLGRIQDKRWQKSCIHFAHQTNAPFLPIYIQAKNSNLFYWISKIAPNTSTALLPREMWQQKGNIIALHIGKLLPFSLFRNFPLSDKQRVALLKKHVYQLKSLKSQGIFTAPEAIAPPCPREALIDALSHTETLLETEEQRIVLYIPDDHSTILHELGRLRELTFRRVGEGSGRSLDTDHYDQHYHHLINIDKASGNITGAYRLCPVASIYQTQGISGLYTSKMFDYLNHHDRLQAGIELGRGFIVPQYWNSRALDQIWQGIGVYYRRYPDIRYLFGSVSIPPTYPREAIDCLVAFYTLYYPASDWQIKAKNPYINDIHALDKWRPFFHNLERQDAEKAVKQRLKMLGCAIPTLFKHYTALTEAGGVVFGDFGVDPDFGYSVDGLVIVDMEKLTPKKYAHYITINNSEDITSPGK